MTWMSPQAWARRCAARPWRTVLVWVLVVIASAVTSGLLLSGAIDRNQLQHWVQVGFERSRRLLQSYDPSRSRH